MGHRGLVSLGREPDGGVLPGPRDQEGSLRPLGGVRGSPETPGRCWDRVYQCPGRAAASSGSDCLERSGENTHLSGKPHCFLCEAILSS